MNLRFLSGRPKRSSLLKRVKYCFASSPDQISWIAIAGGVMLCIFVIGPSPVHATPPTRQKIAATFPLLAGIVERLSTNMFEVTSILRGNVDPHTFEAKPSDGVRLKDTRLLIGIGGGFDSWAFNLFKPEKTNHSCNELSFFDTVSKEKLKRDYYIDSSLDPHIWLDPIIVRDELVPKITEALVTCFEQREIFEKNAKEFQMELTKLDEELKSLFLPLKNKKFLSIHSSWTYFCRRYGLDLIGELEESPAKRSSMLRLVTLIKRAQAEHVTVVVAQVSPEEQQIASKIANEIGGVVLVLDTLGVTSTRFPPDYVTEVKNIARKLHSALDS